MTRGSLRLRLFLAAVLAVGAALIIAGFLLVQLFDRHVTRRVDDELAAYLRQLSGAVDFHADGSFVLTRELADARFDEPYSGLYWQIEDDKTGQMLSSRSLWDTRIPLDGDILDLGGIHHHILPGPNNTTLRVLERSIAFDLPTGSHSLRMAVAIDDGEIAAARRAFAADLGPSLAVLGAVLLAAIWLQISVGLKPLEAIRRGVQAVRSGQSSRLTNAFPSEVRPLVDEVNDLLKAQEESLAKARARATDLAHGLKTPLTVLQTDAARLREGGQAEIAYELESLADSMRRHIDQELARSRIRGTESAATPVSPLALTVERVVHTLQRTPRGGELGWRIDIPGALQVAVDAHDLTEMLGNLLDNACKWADAKVSVTAGMSGDAAEITIADDGPGVPEVALPSLAERGVRFDERTPGSGIGLAIVQDIASACQGSLHFANNEAGGFRVTLTLPVPKTV